MKSYFPDGSNYSSEIKNCKMSGMGKLFFLNSKIYEDMFKNNKFEGKDESSYFGEFVNNLYNGKGTLTSLTEK